MFDRVIATVNGEIVTISQVREVAWGLSGRIDLAAAVESAEFHQAMELVVSRLLLTQAAEKAGAQLDRDRVTRMVEDFIKRFRRNFESPEQYAAFLARNGLSESALRDLVQQKESDQYLIRQALSARVRLGEEEVAAHRRKLEEEGKDPVRYAFDHILLRFPEPADEAARARTLQQAVDLASRIQRGEEFETLAQAHSEDRATADRGGYVGLLGKSQLDPAILQTLERMAEDQVSAPTRTDQGYHILHLRSKRDARADLFELRADEERTRWLRELRARANIQYIGYTPPPDVAE